VSVPDFGFQLSFADGVSQRSAEGGAFSYGVVEVGANLMLVNLSTAYFNVQYLTRAPQGEQTAFMLGAGLQLAADMIRNAGGVGMSNFIVIVSGDESFDNAGIWPLEGIAATFLTVSVTSTGTILSTFSQYFGSSPLAVVVPTYLDLTQNDGSLEQHMMDYICTASNS
jgi:hypothetical protein